MIGAHVEVLRQLPGTFVLDRVRIGPGVPYAEHVRLERWKQGGKAYRWRLLMGPVVVLDVQAPILFNGEDPHERFPSMVQNDVPDGVSSLDMRGPLAGWFA